MGGGRVKRFNPDHVKSPSMFVSQFRAAGIPASNLNKACVRLSQEPNEALQPAHLKRFNPDHVKSSFHVCFTIQGGWDPGQQPEQGMRTALTGTERSIATYMTFQSGIRD